MKRIAALVCVLMLVSLFAGCSILSRAARRVLGRATPAPAQTAVLVEETAEPEATAAPEETQAEETAVPEDEQTPEDEQQAPPDGEEFTSARLGVAFTLPDSWSGKYRVEEGDGYLSVYFAPDEPVEEGMGNFFSIVKKTSDEDDGFLDNAVDIEINGVAFIFGTPTDVPYLEGAPEFDTYVKMLEDLPAIRETVRAAE